MGTLAEKLQKLADTKAAIKAAIIAKGQSVSNTDTFASYADKIAAIQTGTDTSDATATASDVLSGKIAYGPNGKIAGTIPTVAVATPSIALSNKEGIVYASVNQAAGYVTSGSADNELELSVQAATTYTPGTSDQTISKYQWLTGDQTIKGDSNLIASNIKEGTSIFGVTGTLKADVKQVATVTVRCYTSDDMNLLYYDANGTMHAEYWSYGQKDTITTYVGAWIYGQVDGSGTLAYNMSGVSRLGPGDTCVVEVASTTATVYFTDL